MWRECVACGDLTDDQDGGFEDPWGDYVCVDCAESDEDLDDDDFESGE